MLFAGFIYLASTQVNQLMPVKTQDEAMLGGPIPGLTRWQLSKFKEGRELFAKEFSVKDGLGPLYNAKSCASCHGGAGTMGGAGTEPGFGSYVMFGKRLAAGRFASEQSKSVSGKLEFSDMDFLLNEGGPYLKVDSIAKLKPPVLPENCKLELNSAVPASAEFKTRYLAPPLFGLGLCNSLSDFYLRGQVGKEMQEAKIKAKAPGISSAIWQNGGRFGYKCRFASLYECAASDLSHQIGITNPLHRHADSSRGFDQFPACIKSLCPADPNDDGKILNKINFYLNLLAPPPPAPLTPEISRGELAFQKATCVACHTPTIRTPEKVLVINPDGPVLSTEDDPNPAGFRVVTEPKFVEIRAMEKVEFHPYSDFLLHDMGAQLADGIPAPAAAGGEWRTAPLWGLRHKKLYLHDGRAKTLADAIKRHGGQAADSVKAYNALSEPERTALLKFLASL
jgi:CxxC motif-containing protein (DUF1111 family)